MEVELYQPFCQNVGSWVVPAYACTEEIIGDYVENDVPGLSQIIILNQKDRLLFKGRWLKGEGYTWKEAMRFSNWLLDGATWVGKDVMIRAVPVTLAEAKVDIAKARQFIRTQNLEKLAVRRFKESKKEKEAQPVESPFVPKTPDVPTWKKTISWANHYAAMKYGELAIGACELEGCLSPAEREQSRGHHIKGTCRVQEANIVSIDRLSDDSPPNASSDELDSDDIVAYDTETSCYTTPADWTRREKRDFRWAHKRDRRTQQSRYKSSLTLPLFQDSKKEDAITYVDWCQQVQALIDHGIPVRRVRDLVMEALEGPPKSDALALYNQGDKSLKDILGVLDKVYGGQTSYIALQSELCNMQQAYGESVKAFYQRMTPIIVWINGRSAPTFAGNAGWWSDPAINFSLV